MNSLKSIKNGAEKIWANKTYVAILGSLVTLKYINNRFFKNDKTKDNKDSENVNIDETNTKIKIDIEKLKYDEKSDLRHIDIVYVKDLLEKSISCGNVSKLEHSIDVLEGMISGYQILNKKKLDNEYNIEYSLNKLIKYRIKSYYNLACLYLDNYNYDKANYYLIKSVDSCDSKNYSHHKYIRNIFYKLQKTDFIC